MRTSSPNNRLSQLLAFRLKDWEFKQGWPLLLIPVAFWLTQTFGLAFNVTQSLPQKVWLVAFNKTPKRQQYVLFTTHLSEDEKNAQIVPRRTFVIKQVLGLPGDVITRLHQDFFINHEYCARAKTHSLKNEPLKPGPAGVLAQDHYFVLSPHPDSLDSRYENLGWVKKSQIIGVAYPLW